MSKRSGYLQRQEEKTEDMSIKIQLTSRQFMIDTLQKVFEHICAPKKAKPIPFELRYPYLKSIRYDRKYK